MRTYKIVSFSVVILLITVLFAVVATIPAASQYDTMQFRYNAAHTGDYSPVAGSVPPNNQQKWAFPTGSGVSSSPAIANGIVYVGSSDHYLYALNAATGSFKWKYGTGGPVDSSPAVADGVVYVGSSDGNVYALNDQTGTKLWSFPARSSAGSPAYANGVVYIGNSEGNVYALNAQTGTKLWDYKTGNEVSSAPACANGVVYVGSGDGNLYAINAATGQKVWNHSTGSAVFQPVVVDNMVYVGNGIGKIYAVDATNGREVWNYAISANVMSSFPAVVNGVVYVGSYNGNFYALNAQTGTLKWSHTIGFNAEWSSPAVANGFIYVGSRGAGSSARLYALSTADGAEQWNYAIKWYGSSPAVSNGVVYMGSDDGKLYAIGNQSTPPHGSTPTTFGLLAASQSVKTNAKVLIKGNLRTGATGLPGQPVELWAKVGTGSWYRAATAKTGTGANTGWVSWYAGSPNEVAQTNQYYVVFHGTGTYAAAKSSIVTIKFENAKTKPYETTLYAYAPKPVAAKGTLNQMWVKLASGNTPLTGQYVFVWKWSGGKFVIVSRIITRTANQSPGAGWALADYRWNSVGTGLYKFVYYGTSPSGITPYALSESNAVQLIWT